MARSPALLALLGLAAIAGYQNRDKLGQLISDAKSRYDDPTLPRAKVGEGEPDEPANSDADFGSIFAAGGVAGSLNDLVDRFRKAGRSTEADSWISTDQNLPVAPDDIAKVIDEDDLVELSRKSGLSHGELLSRLSTVLPETIDKLTPEGRIPAPGEA